MSDRHLSVFHIGGGICCNNVLLSGAGSIRRARYNLSQNSQVRGEVSTRKLTAVCPECLHSL